MISPNTGHKDLYTVHPCMMVTWKLVDGWAWQGRIQQVAEGAQAPPWLGKIICLCLTHWQIHEIEVKIEALSDLVLEAEYL